MGHQPSARVGAREESEGTEGRSVRVLVACEFSGIVREAFRKRGHDAWSCDLEPAEDNSPFHYRGNVFDLLTFRHSWDMMLAFPPCTHLTASGARYWVKKRASGELDISFSFFMGLTKAAIPRVCIENPVGIISTLWRRPDQIIHPYQFGHPERKMTCLWLKGLPHLAPTAVLPKPPPKGYCIRQSGPRKGRRYNYYYHQGKSAKERSRTFQGIADAMAEQWGNE